MSDELKKDIVDGRIINWENLSLNQLKDMKEEYKKKEKEILAKIDKELKKEDDDEYSL